MCGYLPTVDGLRAVAVTAVLVFHLRSSWLPGGFVGVDVFFVISGYLITSQLVRELDAGTFSLVAFYQRRIARLVPMAALVGVGTTLFAGSVGTCFLLAGGMHAAPLSEALSARSLVWIGKRSYSIYLWHWPVYSFVDFGLYDQSFVARAVMKVVATATLGVGYRMWENPLRLFLVRPRHGAVAFGGPVSLVMALGLWGRSIRSENYLDLDGSTIASGGHFVPAPTSARGTVMLMGDSHAVMYASGLRDLALEEGYDFRSIAVTALRPFPSADATQTTAWLDSVEAVREHRPAVLVYVPSWQGKAADASELIRQAASLLRAETDRLILITQPPVAPAEASRESLREGAAGPFAEDSRSAAERASAHQSLLELREEGIEVVDIERLFTGADGSVRILDDEGRFLYQDRSHLTSDGAQLVIDQILALGIL